MIHISISTTEPVTGYATKEGDEPLRFVGWLDLLRVLSKLVGAEAYSTGEELSASRGESHLYANHGSGSG